MKQTITNILTDAAHNDYIALYGLLDELLIEKGIDPQRVIRMASERFNIPQDVATRTILDILSN